MTTSFANDETASNPAIAKATESVQAAAPVAAADPDRPVWHFRPAAQWMNDPNGTIYFDGWYHVFYQYNPYGDGWGHMHWGHTRSRDLVHWELLPVALWPSEEKGEEHCYSGTVAINSDGRPTALYTSVGFKNVRSEFEQWAALGDDDLTVWEKHPANPILTLETHGGPKLGPEWRDPFIFSEAGRTFLLLGADTESHTDVLLYEAADGTLTKWEYKKVLFRQSKPFTIFLECPNFFKLGDKWVLAVSPYRAVEYYVGTFDINTLEFKQERHGRIDESPDFYATNIAIDEKGRRVLFGWVRGFKQKKGWNGCLALPRIPSIGPDGYLRMSPAPEIRSLRGDHTGAAGISLENGGHVIDGALGDTLEVLAEFTPGDAVAYGLKVRRSDDGSQGIPIRIEKNSVSVGGKKYAFEHESGKSLTLNVFIDKSLVEVFIDGGRVCVTRVIYSRPSDLGVEVFAEGGSTRVDSIDVWTLKPVW